jgi:hypothetical protein
MAERKVAPTDEFHHQSKPMHLFQKHHVYTSKVKPLPDSITDFFLGPLKKEIQTPAMVKEMLIHHNHAYIHRSAVVYLTIQKLSLDFPRCHIEKLSGLRKNRQEKVINALTMEYLTDLEKTSFKKR